MRGQLSIDFVHRFSEFVIFFLDISSPFDQVHSYICIHVHLSPNIPISIKEEGRYIFKFHEIHNINETFEKSYILIGLSTFVQTFDVRWVKSSSIHPICLNAWGSFSFNPLPYKETKITELS